jgi:hypothetical protein
VFAHSWPGGHLFIFDSSTQYDYYYSNEYTTQDPPTNFYNFFACSFSRYTTGGYGGGAAVFNQDYGLASMGSTKTGSMLDFGYFYQPLGEGKTLGQAFRDWFTYICGNDVTFDELCWHYGMTLIGDPFLLPLGHTQAVAENRNVVEPNRVIVLGNPVTTRVRLNLALDRPSEIAIALYDCSGRKIKAFNQRLGKGDNYIELPLQDRDGAMLSTGVYILHVTTPRESFSKKIVKL